MPPLIVLCSDPLEASNPDRASAAGSLRAIEQMGFAISLIDFDALTRGASIAAVTRGTTQRETPVLGIYRGWMATPGRYEALYGALHAKGVCLINDPAAYRHAHYLPENYSLIAGRTPHSVWLTGELGLERIMDALKPFGDRPIVVRDFVKSRKHEWAEACFIPSAGDRREVERVVVRFLELQADDLCEGLVFREFVEFHPIGVHAKSGMPLTKEYRSFWLDGELLYLGQYWG